MCCARDVRDVRRPPPGPELVRRETGTAGRAYCPYDPGVCCARDARRPPPGPELIRRETGTAGRAYCPYDPGGALL